MTEINLKGDGWELSIKVHPGINPDVKKKLYEIAEQILFVIPDEAEEEKF